MIHADSISVHHGEGAPTKLVGTYWKFKDTTTNKNVYFYVRKNYIVAKHTKYGNFTSKYLYYSHYNNQYIINGNYNDNNNYAIWWLLKPNKNWTKLKIGYVRTSVSSYPSHLVPYYEKNIATKVTAVTAILH